MQPCCSPGIQKEKIENISQLGLVWYFTIPGDKLRHASPEHHNQFFFVCLSESDLEYRFYSFETLHRS